MKNRASLFLMEQLVMLLVFALCAALCLGAFARADALSADVRRRSEAAILAQNAAELLKSTGDPEAAMKLSGGDLTMSILEEDSGIAGLKQAKIVISHENREIFVLQTGWQEVGR